MSADGALRAATTVALWAAAWQGGASADDVLGAIQDVGQRAGVRAANAAVAERSGLPGPGEASAGTTALLPVLRAGGEPVLLVPRPGDLRGLPVCGDAVVAGLDAGAAVQLPETGLALVPADGQWRIYESGTNHPAYGLSEAHDMVDSAVRRATRSLTALDIARDTAQGREQVRRIMLREAVRHPPGMPRAASTLLASVISLHALLAVASAHETAAVSNQELAAVDDALQPLVHAVAEGRRAAVAVAVAALRQGPTRQRPHARRVQRHNRPVT